MGTPTYQQTLDYLYKRLPMFSRIGKAALKPDLTNTIKLCSALGDPHNKFRSVHIAGTNGKGSTSHGLAAVLQHAGYKTGLYTSPHLLDFRERIRINGQPVSEEWVVNFVAQNRELIEEVSPSFFEITVAMAFTAFAEEKVDIAVIETGLGGRLDSTNIITPLLSVITNISYDHKDLLGDTLQQIAAEKAGIIKPHVPVIIGEQQEETEQVFFENALHKQSSVYYAYALWGMVRVKQDTHYQHYKAVSNARREMYDLRTDLAGSYQQHNIKTILAATELLSYMEFSLPIPAAIDALANVKGTTGLRGRWDVLQQNPAVICDVAHNPAGLKEVLAQFETINSGHSGNNGKIKDHRSQIANKHIVLGFVKDKDIEEALALFPGNATYYFCNAHIERALPAAELKEKAEKAGLMGAAYASVEDAVNAAKEAMTTNDALLITGSFFIAAEAMKYLHHGKAGLISKTEEVI